MDPIGKNQTETKTEFLCLKKIQFSFCQIFVFLDYFSSSFFLIFDFISMTSILVRHHRSLWKRSIHLTSNRFDKKRNDPIEMLKNYEEKRNFQKTNEPKPIVQRSETNQHRFVVQEHHASILHFDFRLENDGVMKSWSIPKGPSLNPRDKRLAILVEDHPISYIDFEGRIPDGQYGAGEVRIWDRGVYELIGTNNLIEQLDNGKLSFVLHGEKLIGEFTMIRFRFVSSKNANQWLLMKKNDRYADEKFILKRILDYGSRRNVRKTNKNDEETFS